MNHSPEIRIKSNALWSSMKVCDFKLTLSPKENDSLILLVIESVNWRADCAGHIFVERAQSIAAARRTSWFNAKGSSFPEEVGIHRNICRLRMGLQSPSLFGFLNLPQICDASTHRTNCAGLYEIRNNNRHGQQKDAK